MIKVQNIITGYLPYLIFPKDNTIHFFQDFSWWQGVPSDIKFYPQKEMNGSIKFIADGYGIIEHNSYGLSGKYGSGAINIDKENLPEKLVEWCLIEINKQNRQEFSINTPELNPPSKP